MLVTACCTATSASCIAVCCVPSMFMGAQFELFVRFAQLVVRSPADRKKPLDWLLKAQRAQCLWRQEGTAARMAAESAAAGTGMLVAGTNHALCPRVVDQSLGWLLKGPSGH